MSARDSVCKKILETKFKTLKSVEVQVHHTTKDFVKLSLKETQKLCCCDFISLYLK